MISFIMERNFRGLPAHGFKSKETEVIMALAEEVRTLLNSSDEEACGCVLASQGCSVALSLVRSRFDFLQRTNEK